MTPIALTSPGSQDLVQDSVSNQTKKRRHFPYSANHTISRCITLEHKHEGGTDRAQINDLIDRIYDHANRRILLLYSLFLAYWKEGIEVTQERTVYQHGSSSCLNCQSAHSSIITNVQDKIGHLPENSYLRHAINSTVEADQEVNQFDMVIENVLRKKAIRLVNQVSFGELHPYEGIENFVDKMHIFFEKARDLGRRKLTLLCTIQDYERKLNRMEAKNIPQTQKYLQVNRQLQTVRWQFKKIRKYTLGGKLPFFDPKRNSFVNRVKGLSESAIKKELSQISPLTPEKYDPIINRIKKSLWILEYQFEGTILPPYPLLSGKLVDGVLVGLDEQELLEQKSSLLQMRVNILTQRAREIIPLVNSVSL